jgi:oligopeptide/dipeptide ABC transporter ATP-binding protein
VASATVPKGATAVTDRVHAGGSDPVDEAATDEPLVSVRDLRTYYPIESPLLGRHVGDVRAVDGVSLDVRSGGTLAVVGESGCGKSTLAESILRLTTPTAGTVRFRGRDLSELSRRELRRLRRETGMVFQDPYASLNDRLTVHRTVAEPLVVHDVDDRERRVATLLESVGLDPAGFADRYPTELSGGQRQRVAVARALALDPSFLVLDEPVSALDVSVRAQVLALLDRLQAAHGFACLLVSHDVTVVDRLADRVAVMYQGQIVERGSTAEVLATPSHPYTEALLSNVPRVDPDATLADRIPLSGEAPDPRDPPDGCRFHPRCHLYDDLEDADRRRCETESPREDGDGTVACHFRPDGPGDEDRGCE